MHSAGTPWQARHTLQGYLAHKKLRPPRTLQQDYALGPMVVLGGGLFLMREVTMQPTSITLYIGTHYNTMYTAHQHTAHHRSTSLIRVKKSP